MDPGAVTIDTETVSVNGNGTYCTPVGFTLPTTGALAGTYTWNATYSGDANNSPAISNSEPVVMSAPSAVSVPTITNWGIIFFAMFAGLGSLYYLARQRKVPR